MKATFPVVDLSGAPEEIGRQYGTVMREPIHAELDGFVERFSENAKLSRDDVSRCLDLFRADYERYAPHILHEIEALAAAAGVGFADALLCRTRWDVEPNLAGGCTSFVAAPQTTRDGLMLAGQNKDVGPGRIDSVVVVRVRPTGRPAFIGYSYLGMLEGPGFNSAGLCRFENSIWVDGARRAVPVHLLKRLLSEQETVADCLDVLAQLRGDGVLGLVAALAVGDATGRAATIEIVPGNFRVVEASDGILGRANNVLTPELQHLDRACHEVGWEDTFARTARINTMLRAAGGKLTVEDCCAALSDHDGHPGSICRHKPHAITVASIVCVPAAGRFYISRGNPCENAYTCYELT